MSWMIDIRSQWFSVVNSVQYILVGCIKCVADNYYKKIWDQITIVNITLYLATEL